LTALPKAKGKGGNKKGEKKKKDVAIRGTKG